MDTDNQINFQPKGLIHSGVWNVSSLIVFAVVGFVTLPIVVREIGAQDYGIYVLLFMIGGFVGLLDFGLGEATLKYLSQYYACNDIKGVNRVIGSTLTVNAIVGILGCSIVIFCSSWIISIFRIDPERAELASGLLKYAGIGFCLSLFAGAFSAIPQAVQRYDILNKVRIIMGILRALAIIVVVKLGYGITGLVILMPINTMLNILVFLVIAFALIPGIHPWPRPSCNGLREVFGYGVFAFITHLTSRISTEIDKFVLGVFFGTAEISYLDVPKRFLTHGAGVYSAAGRALFPRFSSMKEDERMRELYLKSTWSLLCLSLVLFVPTTIVLPEFLRLWMGKEFASQSVKVAQFFAASYALHGAFVPFFHLLKGTGRINWLAFIQVSMSLTYTCVSILFIINYGLIGAGYRQLITAWLGFVILMLVYKKCFPEARLLPIFWLLIIPILISAICGFSFWFIWEKLELNGWFYMILAWILMAGALWLLLAVTDLLATGHNGVVGKYLKSHSLFIKRKEYVHHIKETL